MHSFATTTDGGGNAGVGQLISVRLPQIESPVAGTVFDEPTRGIGSHAQKRGADAIVDLVVTRADARADRRDEIGRRNAQLRDRLDRGSGDA